MFTDTEKLYIRFFLGYPDVYRYANSRLESAIDVIGGRPETVILVRAILAQLIKFYGLDPLSSDPPLIDQVIGNKMGASKIKDYDTEIEFGSANASKNGSTASTIYNELLAWARPFVAQLSIVTGIPIANNIFGVVGYQGDNWKSWSGMSSNWFGA